MKTFLLTLLFATTGFISSAQTIQTLYSFQNTNGADAENPLTLGDDGNFYGMTLQGGNTNLYFGGYGTVFKITTNGALTTLASFDGNSGMSPYAGLIQGLDGSFYGTTSHAGNGGIGNVFKVTTNGVLTTLVLFNLTNGYGPSASLTLGKDGNFYGTTSGGGITNSTYPFGYGTVFKVTASGTLTPLVFFNGTNGQQPDTALTLGTDGNFYGTTTRGGSSGAGTVFKMTTNGVLTTLASFNITNGQSPNTLTLGNDGNFYGTTKLGGITNLTPYGFGSIFKITTNGTLTTLFNFNDITNGRDPYAGLTQGQDGNFYGATASGGITNSTYPFGCGTLFKVTPNGALTTLASFNGTNGMAPSATLTLGTDGNFYGTTAAGGSGDYGTVFRLLLPPLSSSPLSLTIAAAGNESVLFWPASLGTNFILQSTTNLISPNWVTASDAVPVISFIVTNTSPTRFFRLQSQ